MILVKNGRSSIRILYGDQEYAGRQLHRYLEKITSARMPLQKESPETNRYIRVGTVDTFPEAAIAADGLPEQGFRITVSGDRCFLVGKDRLAALHAVYSFLERYCGCGWCGFGESGETVPRKRTLEIPDGTDLRERPDLKIHGMQTGGRLRPGGKDIEHLDWMIRNRMNFAYFGCLGWEDFREHAIREAKEKRGMRVAVGFHTWSKWLPPERYFPEHPEYFSFMDGKRRDPRKTPGGAQVCGTNPDVVRLFVEHICRFLEENPAVDVIGLGPNDGSGWCECAECRKLEPYRPGRLSRGTDIASKRCFSFVNAVVERVSERHPGKRFACFAYSRTLEPPEEKDFRLHPNVDLVIALFERLYDRPLNAGLTPDDAKTLDLDFQPMDRKYTLYPDLLRRWREIAPGDIYLHKYYMAHNACRSLPFPIHTTLVEDMRFFREIGLDGYYGQYAMWPDFGGKSYPEDFSDNFGVYGLNYYLAAHTSWDTRQTLEETMSRYCRSWYGTAADAMKRYHLHLGRASRAVHFSADPNTLLQVYTPAVVREGNRLLAEARKKGKEPAVRRRIRMAWTSLSYASRSAEIREEFVSLLKNDLPTGKVAEVCLRMKNLRKKEEELLRFIRTRMLGKGLFHFANVRDVKPDVDSGLPEGIKRATFKIRRSARKEDFLT